MFVGVCWVFGLGVGVEFLVWEVCDGGGGGGGCGCVLGGWVLLIRFFCGVSGVEVGSFFLVGF